MKGRPRKPAKLHLLDGSYREDRHGAEPEATGIPVKPTALKGAASKLWDELVPRFITSGIVTAWDTSTLFAMCQWWGRYLVAGKRLDALFASKKPAASDLHYFTKIADLAGKAFDRLAARFGMTPADRARLRVQAQQKADPLAAFEARRPA
jgi:P27 family predicted phage terminase small subunit